LYLRFTSRATRIRSQGEPEHATHEFVSSGSDFPTDTLTGTHRISHPRGTADWVATSFNQLVAQRGRVRNAWAEIDVQLTRRHDLTPNLVESVRGYMQPESSTLNSVTQTRAQAMAAAGNVQQRALAESALTQAVGKLLAVAENYPQLRSIEGVQQLQEQLVSAENRLA
jgi:LemA protein